MNTIPLLPILNQLLFNRSTVAFDHNDHLALSADFIQSIPLLLKYQVSPYWLLQIHQALQNLDSNAKTQVLQYTLNRELHQVVMAKAVFGVYPESIGIVDFDLAKDGYAFVYKNEVSDALLYLVYEIVFKCVYDSVSLEDKFVSKEKYTAFCFRLSESYHL
ncbi:hypothetical protein HXZ88_04115 [Myroides odoratimimus]|uniref:hypothetical protein n=1 Tax=Myroides TaxID=76831 RepID=UPI00131CA511|nr:MULTISPECIES: hypothetical protein [Myroides]MDM1064804.1 hypothetical protein [Myroides odoratimimus]MDM1400891.1 hypothetical protein [Myroides odoratimimus]MDM1443292.1 hypothetical protein [Myroides odoratimimus]